jgi:hypothetical protein
LAGGAAQQFRIKVEDSEAPPEVVDCFARMSLVWIEDDDLALPGMVTGSAIGKPLHAFLNNSDCESFMGVPSKGMSAVTRMEELNLSYIVSTPKVNALPDFQMFLAAKHWGVPSELSKPVGVQLSTFAN